jgi:BirA family biotin operon repressor/biotin-[acetyl-CoA-carboxylase] ligase
MMQTLLALLQDGKFHSGQAIGCALGVSRSAVWKQLQCLQVEYGIQIHSVPGRGYRLESALSALDMQKISAAGVSWPIYVHERIDSTNSEALRGIAAGLGAPFVVLAELQTNGRGRRGRDWLSPYGQNVYCSLAWRIEGGLRHLDGLSLVVGLAVLRALRNVGLVGGGLKWPNDILVDGRKIGGVLLELVGDPADVCHVVIGIGINANMQMDGGKINQPWTSLRAELGVTVDRCALVAALALQLEDVLGRHRRNGFAELRSEWEAAHLWRGCMVTLSTAQRDVVGLVMGVDHSGALRLSVDGEERVFSGGEISLRLRDDS